jgi:hypothetical protein
MNSVDDNLLEIRDNAFELLSQLEEYPVEKTLNGQDYKLVSARALSETVKVTKILIDALSYGLWLKQQRISLLEETK